MRSKISSLRRSFNGIWFYGLAGSGKSFASQICSKLIENAFIIDGDDVRNLISFDLGYSLHDREIQVRRVYGLAEIAIKNYQIPVLSTVTMSEEIFHKCHLLDIKLVEIIRQFDQLKELREIYQSEHNVVGKDIHLKKFDTIKLYNSGNKKFEALVKNLVE